LIALVLTTKIKNKTKYTRNIKPTQKPALVDIKT